jgi:hypothetical protein
MKLNLLLILLLVSIGLSAQKSKWNFGIESGINIARIDEIGKYYAISSSARSLRVAPGFSPSFGLVTQYQFVRKFAIQSGLIYSPVNTYWSYQWLGGESTLIESKFRIHLNFLNVPFILNYSILDREKIQFLAGLGTSVGYSLKSNMDIEYRFVQNPIYPPSTIVNPPEVNLRAYMDFLLISPTVQSAVDFKLKNSKAIRLVLTYSFSANQSVLSNSNSPNQLRDFGLRFHNTRLQVLSLLFQYRWPGLNPIRK